MFSFLKKRKKPKLNKKDFESRDETIKEARRQVSEYFNEDIYKLKLLDEYHLINTAAYVSGFLNGYRQAQDGMKVVRTSDEDLKYFSLCFAVYECIFAEGIGPEMMRAQLEQGPTSENWDLLDRFGGSDGIDHFKGEPKQMNGSLLHYFNSNYP